MNKRLGQVYTFTPLSIPYRIMDADVMEGMSYKVVQYRKYMELKIFIRDLKASRHILPNSSQKKSNLITSFFSSLLETKADLRHQQYQAVNSYWDEDRSDGKTTNLEEHSKFPYSRHQQLIYEDNLINILILQKTFRTWLYLRRFKRQRQLLNKSTAMIVLRQAVVRRWLAIQSFMQMEENKNASDQRFCSFIKHIHDGLRVEMFSKTFGDLRRRRITFDSSFHSLVYKTSKWMPPTTIALNSVCDVKKGLSGYKYAQLIRAHKAWCFHLVILGGKVVDLQAEDGQQAKELFLGFKKLILLFFTQSPFYIDKRGVPRRCGPSIIKHALRLSSSTSASASAGEAEDDEAARRVISEADRMRYRAALRMLRAEYEEWDKQARLAKNAQLEAAQSSPSAAASGSPESLGKSGAAWLGGRPSSPLFSSSLEAAARATPLEQDNARRSLSRANTLRKSSIEFVFPHKASALQSIETREQTPGEIAAAEAFREEALRSPSPSPTKRLLSKNNGEEVHENGEEDESGNGFGEGPHRAPSRSLTGLSYVLGWEKLRTGTIC